MSGQSSSRAEGAKDQQRLSMEEEEALVRHIHQLSAWNFPPRVHRVRYIAEMLLRAKGDTTPLGNSWMYQFLRRHPDLHSAWSRARDRERSNVTFETAEQWFELFHRTYRENDIHPDDTYNMDEKGFAQGDQGKQKTIVPKSYAAIRTQCGNREWVSVTEGVSSSGWWLPPWIVFKGKTQQRSWRDIIKQYEPDGQTATSEKGWTDNELRLEWLHHFHTHTINYTKGEFRLPILNGHDSHISSAVIEFALQYKIILLCLPAHATHFLQPLDISIFGPIARVYNQSWGTIPTSGLIILSTNVISCNYIFGLAGKL